MQGQELDTAKIGDIGKIWDHPDTKRILDLLGSTGAMSWEELQAELRSDASSIFYHLDTLEGIVFRDASKKYHLTERGRTVYSYLRGHPRTGKIPYASRRLNSRRLIRRALVPRWFLYSMTATKVRSTVSLIASSISLLLMAVYSRSELILFSITGSPNAISSIASSILSVFSITAIAYLATVGLFKSRPDLRVALPSAGVSLLPMGLFSSVIRLFPTLRGVGILTGSQTFTIALVAFQAWSAILLGAGVSVASGVRIEKSLMVGLAVLYASSIFSLLFGNTG